MSQASPLGAPRIADPCPGCGQEVGEAWLVCAWCGEQIAAPAELAAGSRLGADRYQILGVIGRGGFGITYEAGDRRLQRRVAIKELFPESAIRHGSRVLTPPHARVGFRTARDRFMREARVLARFTHPGIVRVYEVFEEHGTAYLVMELLDGQTLVDILRYRGEPFSEAEVLDVAGRVAAALRPVHVAGVLHRDINPSNVVLTGHGRIVVIDFGLARDFDQSQTRGMTRVVTPGYAPLEQYRGEGRFGPTTDVYGLAATCYRLATGRVPVAAVERDAGAHLPTVQALNPAISKAVSDAIGDGLELDAGHRPQDLDAFLARLGVRRLPEGPRSILMGTVGASGSGRVGRSDTDAARPSKVAGSGQATRSDAHSPRPGGVVEPGRAGQVDVDATRLTGVAAAAAQGSASVAATTDRTATQTRVVAPVGAADGTTVLRPSAADRTQVAGSGPIRPAGTDGPAPLTADVVGRRHGDRLPVAVGPHPPGRAKVTVPLTALAVAAATAAPVVVTAAVVLVALPLLATSGDSVAHRLRSDHGINRCWAERRYTPGALAPARFGRNMLVSVLRALPMLAVGGALLGSWYALSRTSAAQSVLDFVLRSIGALVVGVLVVTARRGSARFRTGLGLDALTARLVPDGRTTERIVVAWLLVALLIAASLWLAPDPFPFR